MLTLKSVAGPWLHAYPLRSKLLSTAIFVHKQLTHLDSKVKETKLGKLLLKLKRKAFGGVLIFAGARRNPK